jgi:hypothetical protein
VSRALWTPLQWTRWVVRVGRDTQMIAKARALLLARGNGADAAPEDEIEEEIVDAIAVTLSRLSPIDAVEWCDPDDAYEWGTARATVADRTVEIRYPREPLARVAFRGVLVTLEDKGDPPPYTLLVLTSEQLDAAADWLQGRISVKALGLTENSLVARIKAWLDEAPAMHANELARELYARFEIAIPAVAVFEWLRRLGLAPKT